MHTSEQETVVAFRKNKSMIVCSICSHSEWCDGGDTCDCGCHDELEDDLDEDDEEIEYDED